MALENRRHEILTEHPLLALLPADDRRSLLQKGRIVIHKPASPLQRPGPARTNIDFVLDGIAVQQTRDLGAKQLALGELDSGDFFGEEGYLGFSETDVEVRTLTEMRTLRVPLGTAANLIGAHPEVSARFIGHCLSKLIAKMLTIKGIGGTEQKAWCDQVADKARFAIYANDEVIATKLDQDPDAYLVVQGAVQIFDESTPHPALINTFSLGDMFRGDQWCSPHGAEVSAVALGETAVISLDRGAFMALLEGNRKLTRRLILDPHSPQSAAQKVVDSVADTLTDPSSMLVGIRRSHRLFVERFNTTLLIQSEHHSYTSQLRDVSMSGFSITEATPFEPGEMCETHFPRANGINALLGGLVVKTRVVRKAKTHTAFQFVWSTNDKARVDQIEKYLKAILRALLSNVVAPRFDLRDQRLTASYRDAEVPQTAPILNISHTGFLAASNRAPDVGALYNFTIWPPETARSLAALQAVAVVVRSDSRSFATQFVATDEAANARIRAFLRGLQQIRNDPSAEAEDKPRQTLTASFKTASDFFRTFSAEMQEGSFFYVFSENPEEGTEIALRLVIQSPPYQFDNRWNGQVMRCAEHGSLVKLLPPSPALLNELQELATPQAVIAPRSFFAPLLRLIKFSE